MTKEIGFQLGAEGAGIFHAQKFQTLLVSLASFPSINRLRFPLEASTFGGLSPTGEENQTEAMALELPLGYTGTRKWNSQKIAKVAKLKDFRFGNTWRKFRRRIA